MTNPEPRPSLTTAFLRAGLAIPLLYYGAQLIVASLNPGYSFIGQAASELGSDRARGAAIFNTTVMIQGALTLLVAVAVARALLILRGSRVLAVLTPLAIAMNGVQSAWAGYYPMPDPRHGGHPVFIVFMLALPVLLTLTLWRRSGPALRVYLILTLLLLAAMVPVMSGMLGDLSAYRGLSQRVFTLTIFPPIGVACWVVASRLRRASTA